MTTPLYLNNTLQFELQDLMIKDVGIDEKGPFFIFDQTIFHPQGGGQPADHGWIWNHQFQKEIIHVAKNHGVIRHYVTDLDSNFPYKNLHIHAKIDKTRRILNARYHSAAHLLANILEKHVENTTVIKAHAFPGEAYLEFQSMSEVMPDLQYLTSIIQKIFLEDPQIRIISREFSEKVEHSKLDYHYSEPSTIRYIQIEGFPAIPCGGTHVATIREIGEIRLKKIVKKTTSIRLSYEVL